MKKTRVLLMHGEPILHYRVPIYRYFCQKFSKDNIDFTVAGPSIHQEKLTEMGFPFEEMPGSFMAWVKVLNSKKPNVVILFSGLRNLFIFPFILLLRLKKIKVIYWGHGINLSNKKSLRTAYRYLHRLSDEIILYAEHLKRYVDRSQWPKVSVAPNTLHLEVCPNQLTLEERLATLERYNIDTTKNIIFVGRMQKRKRINDLLKAHSFMQTHDIGVVLVGPDVEGVLPKSLPDKVIHIPCLYGKKLFDLMMACDICCCPGWVGLNIVDAMACGLPFVTEDVEHAPEIMYLKDGINGVLVPRERIDILSETLLKMMGDESCLRRMGDAARLTYQEEASIERMYQGFFHAIQSVV